MKTCLVAAYSPYQTDGRVLRSIDSLGREYKIVVFTPKSSFAAKNFHKLSFTYLGSLIRWGSLPNAISLPLFWVQLLVVGILVRPSKLYMHDYQLLVPAIIFKLLGGTVIYDAHELLPNIIAKRMSRYQLKWYSLLEALVINYFDLIVCANHERALIMKKRYGLSHLPYVIQNIPELQLSSSVTSSKEPGRIRVVYVGNLSFTRGLLELVGSFKLLPSSFTLTVVGNGPARSQILDMVDSSTALQGRVSLLKAIPDSDINEFLTPFDIGIVTYDFASDNSYYCAPNKIYQYAHSSLPFVCSCQPFFTSLLESFNIGMALPTSTFSSVDFSRVITQLASSQGLWTVDMSAFRNKFLEVRETEHLDLLNAIKGKSKNPR